MKVMIKAIVFGIVACAIAAPASAYTLSGMIPPGGRVTLRLLKPLPPGAIKLTMSAPPVNAGVPYAITYCIGSAANPCGLPSDLTFEVGAGKTIVRSVPSHLFTTNMFVVGQGTKKPVPYKVQIN
jgi:hypothetical protein